MIRLSKSQVLLIHDQLIVETGGSSGLRDEGMLDSALDPGTPSLKAIFYKMAFLLSTAAALCLKKQVPLENPGKPSDAL